MILLESFTALLRDPAHWYFELFVGAVQELVFGVLVGAFLWPRLKAHIHRDINRLEEQHGHFTATTDDEEPQHRR